MMFSKFKIHPAYCVRRLSVGNPMKTMCSLRGWTLNMYYVLLYRFLIHHFSVIFLLFHFSLHDAPEDGMIVLLFFL